jgi:hypothetical protein
MKLSGIGAQNRNDEQSPIAVDPDTRREGQDVRDKIETDTDPD